MKPQEQLNNMDHYQQFPSVAKLEAALKKVFGSGEVGCCSGCDGVCCKHHEAGASKEAALSSDNLFDGGEVSFEEEVDITAFEAACLAVQADGFDINQLVTWLFKEIAAKAQHRELNVDFGDNSDIASLIAELFTGAPYYYDVQFVEAESSCRLKIMW